MCQLTFLTALVNSEHFSEVELIGDVHVENLYQPLFSIHLVKLEIEYV